MPSVSIPLLAAGAGFGASKLFGSSGDNPTAPNPPAPPPIPPSANPSSFANPAVQSATGGAKRRQAAAGANMDQTLFTGPEGISGGAPTAKQTLGA